MTPVLLTASVLHTRRPLLRNLVRPLRVCPVAGLGWSSETLDVFDTSDESRDLLSESSKLGARDAVLEFVVDLVGVAGAVEQGVNEEMSWLRMLRSNESMGC